MPSKSFDPVSLFAPNLPAPAQRWNGFPEFNFVGGNNDAEGVPVTGLIDAATKVLQREGKTLATYSLNSGPQGYLPLREFVAGKVRKQRGIRCSADDVLITSGSLQGIDLVNELFLAPGGYRADRTVHLRRCAVATKASRDKHGRDPARRTGTAH
jgi:2-aminoadipate transaminase